jgi:NAD(P)-dependent dehydrogenase (short-subunit alcohol dehydrogenase family)
MTPVAETSDELYRSLVEASSMGTFYVLPEAARMVRDGGRIINVSSSPMHFRPLGTSCHGFHEGTPGTAMSPRPNSWPGAKIGSRHTNTHA